MGVTGPKPRPAIERVWNKVNKNGPIPAARPELGACWLWTGCRSTARYTTNGIYGVIARSKPAKGLAYVHVVVWEGANGPVPKGLELDHLCRVQLCVRPSHLEAVTHAENVRRGMAGFRGPNAPYKTHCPHGHSYTDENSYKTLNKRTGRIYKRCRICTITLVMKRYYSKIGLALAKDDYKREPWT